MRIIFQHDSPLPVKKYGGIERMLFWHMKELVKQGHEPILIGHPDSEVENYGIKLIKQNTPNWWQQIPSGCDAIELFYNFTPPVDLPTLNMIGGNGKIGEMFSKNTAFVSRKHAANHGSVCFVYNALDLEEYPFRPKEKRNWHDFLFLAKASWSVKNLKQCIKATKKNKKHLHIAGGKPLLPSRYYTGYGMVGGDEKLDIIRRCDAMLFPIRWQEPFGLAVIEAMTQGLPVLGSAYGSLPELIIKGTGIVLNSFQELVEAIDSPKDQFDPDFIRKYVEDNFHIDKFTRDNVKLIEKIVNGEELNQIQPTWKNSQRAEELLPF